MDSQNICTMSKAQYPLTLLHSDGLRIFVAGTQCEVEYAGINVQVAHLYGTRRKLQGTSSSAGTNISCLQLCKQKTQFGDNSLKTDYF